MNTVYIILTILVGVYLIYRLLKPSLKKMDEGLKRNFEAEEEYLEEKYFTHSEIVNLVEKVKKQTPEFSGIFDDFLNQLKNIK